MIALCDTPLRTGPCQMDAGHKGRHSTAVFTCDACGKRRRGQPFRYNEVRLGDGSVDDVFGFCFMCVTVDEPRRLQEQREQDARDGYIY